MTVSDPVFVPVVVIRDPIFIPFFGKGWQDQERADNGTWGSGVGAGRSSSSLPSTMFPNAGKPGYCSRAVAKQIIAQRNAKIAGAPIPTKDDLRKNIRSIATSKRAGGELGGNSKDTQARMRTLIREQGIKGGPYCVWTGQKLTAASATQDKIFTANVGGRYKIGNLLIASFAANSSRQDSPVRSGGASITNTERGMIVTQAKADALARRGG